MDGAEVGQVPDRQVGGEGARRDLTGRWGVRGHGGGRGLGYTGGGGQKRGVPDR